MPIDGLLPEFLRRTEDDSGAEDGVLHECRHCGSKFDDHRETCPVCGASEIATYEFGVDDEDDS